MKSKLIKLTIFLAALFFLIVGNWANSKPDYYLSAKVLEAGEKQAVIQMANGAKSTLIYPNISTILLPEDILIVGVRLDELILHHEQVVPKDLLVIQRTNWSPITSLPLKYTGRQAAKDGCCVFGNNGMIFGTEAFNGFTIAAKQGIPCHIRLYYSGWEGYPILYDVIYSQSIFSLTEDLTRGKGDYWYEIYTHLYEGKRWCNWDDRWEYAAILTNAETYSEKLFQQSAKGVFILYQDH